MNSEPAPIQLQTEAMVKATCPVVRLAAVRSTHGLESSYPFDVDKLKDLADFLDDRAHRLVLEAQQEAKAMTERAQIYRELAATEHRRCHGKHNVSQPVC
jgi:hypothetical protein